MESTIRGKLKRFGLAACIIVMQMFTAVQGADAGNTIWQSRDQFVALERQDSDRNRTVPANDHPAELSLERLKSMLASVRVRAAADEKSGPLFTVAAIEAIAPHIRQALRQANPADDVIFAVLGLHDSLFGFAKSPKVTTGRIFYKSGQLNLILGLVQKDVNEREDRRLAPFTPGSRQNEPAGEWLLETDAQLVRKGWIVFREDWQAPALPIPVSESKSEPTQSAPQQSPAARVNSRTPSERLIILNDLKEKGLITDQEYRSKRTEILNGI